MNNTNTRWGQSPLEASVRVSPLLPGNARHRRRSPPWQPAPAGGQRWGCCARWAEGEAGRGIEDQTAHVIVGKLRLPSHRFSDSIDTPEPCAVQRWTVSSSGYFGLPKTFCEVAQKIRFLAGKDVVALKRMMDHHKPYFPERTSTHLCSSKRNQQKMLDRRS
ncbi:hypothetical protein NDU88_004883 [Pleurodeles waltl]|uniref:Uncharacterized protein n=1 Tax=Pleurodeles waltl TaxID=8319 RepID=A0AAV7TV04_PLEWA|nr:hypothetical protein NDU88_004883 [Pleurodeles waltl]